MATTLRFSWRSYCAPTPKLATRIANAVLTGALFAVPYVATLRISDDAKYSAGMALGGLAVAARVVVRFFSDSEEPDAAPDPDPAPVTPDETVPPATGEEPNGPTT